MGNGTLLPVAGFIDRCRLIEKGNADGGQARGVVLKYTTHVSGLR